MGPKPTLSDMEKGQILAMNRECISQTEIATTLGRSRCAVQSFLANPGTRKVGKKRGAKPKISKTQHRAMLRMASQGHSSASEIHKQLSLPISVRRVQQLLSSSDFLVYKKMVCPHLICCLDTKRRGWSGPVKNWSGSRCSG